MEPQPTRGRPRQFDREEALRKAMLRFWQLGYDATSVRNLAAAMGIAQPSLYSSYGSKAELYVEAISAFEKEMAFLDMSALTQAPTLSGGVDRLLNNLVKRFTKSGLPKGCMVLSGTVADIASQRRLVLRLRERRRGYQAALSVGLETWLPLSAASAEAARLVTFVRGLSEQSRDGVPATQLRERVLEICKHVR